MQELRQKFITKTNYEAKIPTLEQIKKWIRNLDKAIKAETEKNTLPAYIKASRVKKLKFIRAEFQELKEII